MINKMQLKSFAVGGVHSIKSAYSAGVEDWIFIRFAKTHFSWCKWNHFDKSDSCPI